VAITCVSLWKPFGKSGRSGPIDEARGQDLLLRGTSLALEEAARDLPGGERLLLVVAGQRKEIDAFTGARLGRRGDEDDRLTEPHERRTTRLFRHAAGLDGQRAAVKIDLNFLVSGLRHRVSLPCGTRPRVVNLRGEKEGKEDGCLLAYPKALDHALVAREIALLEVVEEPAALSHQLEQPTTGMVVLPVRLEVPRQVPDAVRQERYLHLRGARVRRMLPIRLHDFPGPLLRYCHPALFVSRSSLAVIRAFVTWRSDVRKRTSDGVVP
jgi:hypothetical protein